VILNSILILGISTFDWNFHFYLEFPFFLGISTFTWNFYFFLEFPLLLGISTFTRNLLWRSKYVGRNQKNRHFDTLYLGGNVHLLIIFSVLGTPFLENFEIDLLRQFINDRNRFAQTIYY